MKNQIWSPDQLNDLGGFRAFSPEGVTSTMSDVVLPEEVSRGGKVLEFPDYAELLLRDPEVKAKLESWVEEQVESRLRTLLSQYQDSELNNAILPDADLTNQEKLRRLEQGLTEKWKSRKAELERQEQVWTDVISEFRKDRESLLRSHEKVWCQSMGHLLRQFQVANSNGIMMALEEWMASTVPEFLEKSPIVVHLSKSDYERIRGSQQELRGPHWMMQADSELRPGQLRLEAGNAGVIFDSMRSFEKLSKLLESDS